MKLHFLILLYLSLEFISSSNVTDCWKKVLFSTKSPYALLRDDMIPKLQRPNGVCKPIHINMVHRHGNRYPSLKDIRNIKSMADKLNEAVNISSDIPLKLPWKCPFTDDQDKLLSTVGEDELYGIGKNLNKHFPELFTKMYSPLTYNFESTCKLRCTHSTNALALGLFEDSGTVGKYKSQPIAIKVRPCDDDQVLRFFDLCEKYIVDVEDNKTAMFERDNFDKGIEMTKVMLKVLGKLGLPKNSMKVKHLKALFLACAYDLGMFKGASGICSLLDEEDRTVIEYSFDLKHFYKRSTAFKITYESSCPLLRDFVNTLKLAATNSSASYVGIFRSAHAETIVPLYGLLGLYIDEEKLTADNYHRMKHRRFRGACLSPFSGNLYFVLYNCGNDGHKIQLYVNEQLTRIPCCESAVECKFETFLKCYERYVEDCHLKKMCSMKHVEL